MAPPDADARFDALQRRLVDLWPTISAFNDQQQTVVVLPSLSLDRSLMAGFAPILHAYEERFLCFTLLLRQPRCRVVMVTSQPVADEVVGAYLDLLGPDAPDPASRLVRISLDDPRPGPVAGKLLGAPAHLERVRRALDVRAHIVAFHVTETERDLALALDVPIFGAASRHATLGTKRGSRRLFERAGIAHPVGASVASAAEAATAVDELLLTRPEALVKLDDGFAGLGNEVVRSSAAIPPAMRESLDRQGGIVEEVIVGDVTSPSVQLRITPLGAVEVLSTHDQVLGGPHGQTYVGCRFPADPAYASDIAADAAAVGEVLASEGVVGRSAVDFVVVRTAGGCERYAIEVNLRKGGTTHPFITAQCLTDGAYDPDRACFVLPDGSTRCYVATDDLTEPRLVGTDPTVVLGAAATAGLAWDRSSARGAVFHFLSGLPVAGRVGFTAIGRDRADAQELYTAAERLVRTLPTA